MGDLLKDVDSGNLGDAANDHKPPIDPLRRVFVPIERKNRRGIITFETTDRQAYYRAEDGSIRRQTPKINGKWARKVRHTWP